MKKINLFILFIFFVSILQAQQNCATAVSITPTTTCNFTNHTTSGTEYWLKFVASSPTVNISLVTVKFGINATHIHNLSLYSGNCSNPVLVADDELPFVSDAKELTIDLNASGLIIGQPYFLKASRQATHTNCDKAGCTNNGSSDPTTFNICVEDINVIIPLDFGLELPSTSHSYTTNRGQLVDVNSNPRPDIKLYTINANPNVYIADNFVSYVFSKIDTGAAPDTLHRVDMTLVGGNLGTRVFKTEKTSSITNFYYGHIPLGVTGNKSYSRAVCNDVYTDIDMQFYSNQDGVKYYFIVHPGADADDIIMKFDGANAINVTPSGGLEIVTTLGTLDFEPPHAYQINPAGNIVPMPWQAKFQAISSNEVEFDVHNYPRQNPLIIQIDRAHTQKGPQDPEWSTFFGGSSNDFGYDITNDLVGNTYVVGETASNNFPVLLGASQPNNAGSKDAFLAKFDDSYEQLWTTYYGGNADDMGRGVTYSKFDDKIYICGQANNGNLDIPVSTQSAGVNSYVDTNFRGSTFIARFNPALGSREWGTFFGGFSSFPTKMASDQFGNVYVVGYTQNFNPVSTSCSIPTSGGFPICNSNGISYNQFAILGGLIFGSGYIAKFNTATELTWSSFFGGNDDDIVHDIAIDEINQKVYIVGYTTSTRTTTVTCNPNIQFPLCAGGGSYFQQDFRGVADGFIAQFDFDNKLKYSTFFGGFNDDVVTGVAVNSIGEVYVTGFTNTVAGIPLCVVPSNNGFPLCNSGGSAFFQNSNNGGYDSFIAKFDINHGLVWSTFIGGDKDESLGYANIYSSQKVIVNDNDAVIIVGNTLSGTSGSSIPYFDLNFGSSYFYQSVHGDQTGSVASDTYVTMFDATNTPIYTSYFGGKGLDNIGNVSFYQDKIYVTGGTLSSNATFPINCPSGFPNPYCVSAKAGGMDVFISQLKLDGTIGIDEMDKDNNDFFSIYPNPTDNEISISFTNDGTYDVQLEIYDLIGKVLVSKTIKKQNHNFSTKINVADFSKGVYFVKLQIDKNSYSAKFIKQ